MPKKKSSPYSDVSTVVCKQVDERLFFRTFEMIEKNISVDWDELYEYWVKYVSQMKVMGIMDKDGELVGSKEKEGSFL